MFSLIIVDNIIAGGREKKAPGVVLFKDEKKE